MNKQSRIVFLIAIALLSYGYLCRILKIYFFWDSRIFGWLFLFLWIVLYLLRLHRQRKKIGRKTIWLKIGIGFFSLFLLLCPIVISLILVTPAYGIATDYIRKDTSLIREIGEIKGFGLIPTGSVMTETRNGITSGNATLLLTVRGSKKYKDVQIDLIREPSRWWRVISLQ